MDERERAMDRPPANPMVSRSAAGGLCAGVAAVLLATAATLAAVVVLARRPAWWPGLAAASLVIVLASALSLVPMLWGLRRSLSAAAVGYFVSMAVRAGVSLGGCLLAVFVGGYPKAPTLLFMVVYYCAVLAVEAAWVGWVLRTTTTTTLKG